VIGSLLRLVYLVDRPIVILVERGNIRLVSVFDESSCGIRNKGEKSDNHGKLEWGQEMDHAPSPHKDMADVMD
jgi:hypothetical protein